MVLLSDDENGSSDMENAKDEEARELNSKKRPAAGTLVVCPESVVTQWARELDEKVSDESKLSVLVYHGGNRTKDPSVLAKYDVVITTYAIVTNEVPKQFLLDEDENDESHSFSNSKKRKISVSASKNRGSFGGTLSRVGWLRVVLDKAQTIKNHRTQVARACCILRAKRRWCLSGAPIQNTVDDLYSYFRNEKHGYKKLQAVLKAVMLRHTKGTLLDGQPLINLPPKKVNLNKVDFSVEELSFYKKLEAESRFFFQFILGLKSMLDFVPDKMKFYIFCKAYAAAGTLNQNYTNILLMLLRLRQACDHPQLVHRSTSDPYGKESVEAVQRLPKEARINLLNRLESSSAICNICNDPPEHLLLRCVAMYFAISAFQNISLVMRTSALSHEGDNFTVVEPPSQEPIKTLVFSQWNGMLDLVELCFEENGIEFRRLDGTMSLAARDRAVKEFSNDPDLQVMLFFWIFGGIHQAEDQAIDRAHRIGQTWPVSVTRVTIKDTVDDRMLFLQEEKRRMVASAYGEDHGGSSATRLTVDDLKYLFMMRNVSTNQVGVNDSTSLGSTRTPVVTLCGHVFCYQCISEHISGDENICPVRSCREYLGRDVVFSESALRNCVANDFGYSSSSQVKSFFQKSEFTSSKIKAVLDILSRSLENGIEFRRLDGTMSLAARDRAVKEFSNDPDIEVMLMSLKAGNLGLNMVAASHVILLDLWWNPSAEDQAIDRAHRIGQTRPVSVTRVTIKDTVEDRMLFLQEEKRRMVGSAYGEDHGGSSATRLTVDDLKYLFMVSRLFWKHLCIVRDPLCVHSLFLHVALLKADEDGFH
ncbi:hypothetical protein F2Q69_00037826 [Brassica cretica]|uniref:Uncharacterized protein n=1 Tax=Brassica cretica TaxID=69181 RepID=A0A8S9SPC7_BRACR|nr:hypothetical protein F2Q69_00037826 [Brassica cretica]